MPDDWDGDTIVVPISAKQRTGIEDLLEAILLVADNMEILANPKGKVIGTVIEAERDRAKGVLATLLVQNGTLKVGDAVVAGDGLRPPASDVRFPRPQAAQSRAVYAGGGDGLERCAPGRRHVPGGRIGASGA